MRKNRGDFVLSESLSRREIIISAAAGGTALLLGAKAPIALAIDGSGLAYAEGRGSIGTGRVTCTAYQGGVATLSLKMGNDKPLTLKAKVDPRALARFQKSTMQDSFGLTIKAGRERLVCDGVRKSASELNLTWGEGRNGGEVSAYDMGVVTGTVIIAGICAIVALGAMAMATGSSVEIEAETADGDSLNINVEGGDRGDGGDGDGDSGEK